MPPTSTSGKPRAVVLSGPSGWETIRHWSINRFSWKFSMSFRSGKSTLINELFKEYPTAFAFSISREFWSIKNDKFKRWNLCHLDTTRSPRPGEQHGRGKRKLDELSMSFVVLSKEYHFVARADMENMIKNGEFLETTEFSGNLYGTR